MSNCKVIAICNQKGGVGKTTTAVSLAIGLARRGKKILAIDADPQSSLTVSLGYKTPDELPVTLAGVLGNVLNETLTDPTEGVLHHAEGIDLMPANIDLSGWELTLVNTMSREIVLREYIKLVKPYYEWLVLDFAPSLSILTVNGLAAADFVIVPVVAHYLPVKGLELLLKTISRVKKQINPNLSIGGILYTMYDSRTRFTKEIVALIEESYGGKINIFKSVIPFSIRAVETSAEGKSIYAYDPLGRVASAYEAFIEEVLEIE
jgi:chromosome partitioning protein